MQGRLGTLIRALAALAMLVAIGACVSPSGPSSTRPGQERLLAQAEKQSRAGDHAAAAQSYETLAAQSVGELKDRFNLRAAREWLRSGDTARAESLIGAVGASLPTSDFALRAVVSADLALRGRRPERALAELDRIPLPLPRELAPEVLELRARALFALGRPVLAINTALERERLLVDSEDLAGNRRLIWEGVQQSAAAGVNLTPPAGVSPIVAGWLELGRAALATQRNPFAADTALNDWRSRHPTHPANQLLSQQVLPELGANLSYPTQIALVLPLSGRLQAAGVAVRDGFMAALLQQDAASRPLLKVYDSGVLGAIDAYRRALADGARFVVGPLSKEEVQAIADAQLTSVLTLTLNYLPDTVTPPALMFQFALDPEDEARQVAARIVADGNRRGLALLPNNDWGQRLYRAFDTELRTQGGGVVGMRFYDPAARDYSEPITDLLLVDESRARARSLTSALGTKLEFEPRHRGDVEFVFVAAQPTQGRSLRPALRFHIADQRLPVYSTSEIFEPDAGANSDLDGVVFPDMPWVISPDEVSSELRSALRRHWPNRARGRGRLYAFGFDAYRLIPLLSAERPSAVAPISGMTGRLAVDERGRVRRELDWARIVDGQVRAVDSPPTTAAAAP